jgi:hypothetical protein
MGTVPASFRKVTVDIFNKFYITFLAVFDSILATGEPAAIVMYGLD